MKGGNEANAVSGITQFAVRRTEMFVLRMHMDESGSRLSQPPKGKNTKNTKVTKKTKRKFALLSPIDGAKIPLRIVSEARQRILATKRVKNA